MANGSPLDDPEARRLIESSRAQVATATGAEQVLAYVTWSLVKEGYYSPNELIALSLREGFTLDDPYAKIRRGTRIEANAVIKNHSVIDADHVVIGAGTILDNAQLSGNNCTIGPNNTISGPLLVANLTLGTGNEVRGLTGRSDGPLTIGDFNQITAVTIANPNGRSIVIGNHNELCAGLEIGCPFPHGDIRIGNYNSLGRAGGGVVSTAYRFTHKWWGDVLVGSHVETTRGAEILGFSMIGWPLAPQEEALAQRLFVHGPIADVRAFFAAVRDREVPNERGDVAISFFGVVKAKMCCLAGRVRAKDGTRIQSSFLKDVFATERNKVYFTMVSHALPNPLQVTLQDRAIERLVINGPIDWSALPTEEGSNGYRPEDAQFYANQG
ncbi:MAG TPA: hypothetical protein VIG30_07570 [Ktedonobacterales bacterium]